MVVHICVMKSLDLHDIVYYHTFKYITSISNTSRLEATFESGRVNPRNRYMGGNMGEYPIVSAR